MTPKILPLPPEIVGKIAAGEVVERPGSVVKELVENAIDAGAKSIYVDVAEGGRDLIRIVDDGCGIAAGELPLAIANHATSKIRNADDLFRISTMGFRGEALASVASVSDFRLQSRPAGEEMGARIEVRQGILGTVQACGCPVGTQIEVRNLFESVPVRRKFLKSKQTELGHVTESVIRIALAQPGVSIALRHNDKPLYELPGNLDRLETIRQFCGSEVAQSLIAVEAEEEDMKITGYVAHPSVSRPNSRLQYLFVNGRFIRDRSLGHAIQEAYRGLMLTGRYPVTFLFLEIPPDQVDVNVHPTKIEVRFQEPRRIYSHILSTIRERFLDADLSSSLRPRPARVLEVVGGSDRASVNQEFSLSSGVSAYGQPDLWSKSHRQIESVDFHSPKVPPAAVSEPAPSPTVTPTVAKSEFPGSGETTKEVPWDERHRSTSVPNAKHSSGPETRFRAIQLHNAYLVVETDDGMLLIDQHALHERVLYEELRRRVATQAVEVQDLLVPEPVDLTPIQVGLLMECQSVLAEAGLKIEEFGDRTLLLQGYPAMLRRIRPAELLRDLAARLEETGKAPSREQLLDDMLHMLACKAAVKAGDPLSQGEIESLVQSRNGVEDAHHCPHGRPTVLRFTLGELERQFQRK